MNFISNRHYKRGIGSRSATLPFGVCICLLFPALLLNFSCSSRIRNAEGRIVIEANISKYFNWQLKEIFQVRDIMNLQYTPASYMGSTPDPQIAAAEVQDGKVKWIIYTDEVLDVSPPFGASILMRPGDSIHISYLSAEPVYSGSNPTYALLTAMMQTDGLLIKPRKQNSSNAHSLADFTEWNQYLDNDLALLNPILDSFAGKVAESDFDFYKSVTIGKIENDRLSAFNSLYDSVQKGYPGLTYASLNSIWDSTQYKPGRMWLRSLSSYAASMNYYHDYNRMEVWRKFNFNFKNDSLNNKEIRTYLYYINAKHNYKNLVRERLMSFILDEQTITEMGLKNNMTQTLLKDYYSLPGYPEYKKWVKSLEDKEKQKENKG